MAQTIKDGRGSGKEAGVSEDKRLLTTSRSSGRNFYVSRDSGQAYHWTGQMANATVGSIVLSLRNLSNSLNLFIDEVVVHGVTSTTWEIYANNGVDTGTTATGVNLNRTSGNVADADAVSTATLGTANTLTSKLIEFASGGGDTGEHSFGDSLILGRNDSINVEIGGATLGTAAIVNVTIDGHFE